MLKRFAAAVRFMYLVMVIILVVDAYKYFQHSRGWMGMAIGIIGLGLGTTLIWIIGLRIFRSDKKRSRA